VKKSNQKNNIKLLEQIYKEEGCMSDNFHKAIKNFLIWVQHRYHNSYSEDLNSNCVMNIIQKIKHYDPEKSKNLASFIYGLARNEITKYNYHQQKRFRTEISIEEVSPYLHHEDPEVSDESSQILKFFKNFTRIEVISEDDSSLINLITFLPDYHPLKLSFEWYKKDIHAKER
jgi:DNA-directed RNA polymerase specialized sigma subunit